MKLLREAWPLLLLIAVLGFSAIVCRPTIAKSNNDDEVMKLKQEIRYRDALIARQREIIADQHSRLARLEGHR